MNWKQWEKNGRKRILKSKHMCSTESVDKIIRLIQSDEQALELLVDIFMGKELRGRTSRANRGRGNKKAVTDSEYVIDPITRGRIYKTNG